MSKNHNKKKLFIVGSSWGALTDYYMYTKYLKNEYQITYFSFKGQIEEKFQDVRYIDVPMYSNRILRGTLFLIYLVYYTVFYDGVIFLQSHFKFVEILSYFKNCSKLIYDIRTVAVLKEERERERYNRRVTKAASRFKNVTVINAETAAKLRIHPQSFQHLPLGACEISKIDKSFESLKLLYVGTFFERNLEKTLEGFKTFIESNPKVPASYDIIGYGVDLEESLLRDKVKELEINSYVKFYGRIPATRLKPFFDVCNVGVAFIPITSYYDDQPPTKIYEYILSGLYCIATSTNANRKIIQPKNGVLIKDSAESFCGGMEEIWHNRRNIDSVATRSTLCEHTWPRIVEGHLLPVLNKCYKIS